MSLPIIGDVLSTIGEIADDLHTSDEERLKLELQRDAMTMELNKSQIAVNLQALKHPSLFIAGARPFVMWVCAFGLAWTYIVQPMLIFIAWLFPQYQAVIETAPRLDMSELITLLLGLLGMSGFRTYEKQKRIDTRLILPDIEIKGER